MTVPVPALRIRVSAVEPVVPTVVPVMVILPTPTDPWVDKVTVRVSAMVNAPPILRVVLVVVILLARLAAPDVENPLGAVIAPAEDRVNVPELVTVMAPPAAAVKLLFTLKLVPLRVAEATETAPENVVVPVAALVCVNAPEIVIALLKVMAPELVTVTVVRPVASAEVPEP